mmetsp:Transcript_7835/g.23444  ORF Transcript_7835/g.23444 Transcript_7835/m.23444 type:complete len:218 (+) Transcript_7835:69-722(+)
MPHDASPNRKLSAVRIQCIRCGYGAEAVRGRPRRDGACRGAEAQIQAFAPLSARRRPPDPPQPKRLGSPNAKASTKRETTTKAPNEGQRGSVERLDRDRVLWRPRPLPRAQGEQAREDPERAASGHFGGPAVYKLWAHTQFQRSVFRGQQGAPSTGRPHVAAGGRPAEGPDPDQEAPRVLLAGIACHLPEHRRGLRDRTPRPEPGSPGRLEGRFRPR